MVGINPEAARDLALECCARVDKRLRGAGRVGEAVAEWTAEINRCAPANGERRAYSLLVV
jgi:hypothetical protein